MVVADVLLKSTEEKLDPEVVVAVALELPEKVVVADGEKVPALCQKSPVTVIAVEVLKLPLPVILRLL